MATQDKVTATSDTIQQRKSEPLLTAAQGEVAEPLSDVALQHESIDSQAAMLKRLNGAQRASALTQISRAQGNRHVQRLVSVLGAERTVQRDLSSPPTISPPSTPDVEPINKEPDEREAQEPEQATDTTARSDEALAPPEPPNEKGKDKAPEPMAEGQIVAVAEEGTGQEQGESPEEATQKGEKSVEENKAANERLDALRAQMSDGESAKGEDGPSSELPPQEGLNGKNEAALSGMATKVGAEGRTALEGQQTQAMSVQQAADLSMGQAQSVLSEMRNAPVNFASSESSEEMQDGGGLETVIARRYDPQSEEERRQLLEQRRATATAMVSGFLGNAASRATDLTAFGQTIPASLQAAAEEAKARVRQAIEEQKATVSTGISQVRGQVQAQEEMLRINIASEHKAATTTIKSNSALAQGQVTKEYTTALNRIAQLENTQLGEVNAIFAQADASYRSSGNKVAAEAQAIGGAQEAAYRNRVRSPKVDDSFLDGPLTDNRNEARADAAREVTTNYKTQILEQASKQADSARAGKPQVVQQIKETVAQYRKALQTHYKTTLESLTGSERQALTQAEQLKKSLLTGLNQGSTAVRQSLQEQEKSQLQILSEQGEQRIAAIDTMAQQATASLQRAIGEAVNSFAEGQQGFLAQIEGMEAPDPEVLAPALDNALAQIDASIAQIQGQLQQQLSSASASLAGAAEQATATLLSIGQTALAGATATQEGFSGTVAKMGAATSKGFAQVTEGHNKSATSTSKTATEAFQQTLGEVSAAFTQLNGGIHNTFKNSITKLEQGLRDAMQGRVSGTKGLTAMIAEEAEKAAAQVQPRWKGIVKWVLIIAVIVVAAFVLGPFLVGALGAVLGSTLGTIVAGAIVGGLANAAVQVISNWHDGKKLFGKDVAVAFGIGVLGGALGAGLGLGAQAAFKAVGSQFMQAGVSQFIGRTTVDWGSAVLGEFIVNGKVTWESVGIALLTAIAMNGAAKVPGIGRTTTRFENMGTKTVQSITTPKTVGAPAAPTMPAPVVDTPTPVVDTPTPVVDTPTTPPPTLDTPTPVVEPPTPVVDTPTPKVETPSPTVEPPTPVVDAPAPTHSQGAKMAQDLGYPAAPEGYHWAKSGGDVILRRNPGMAETLPRLTYDPKAGTFVSESASIGHRHVAGKAHEGVQRASEFLKQQGVPRQYRKQILESFEIETINVRQAGPNEFGTRYYDGVNAHAKGRYVFETLPAGRQDLALPPEWNQMSNVQQWQIRPGTTIIEGRVGPQGVNYPGGNIQKYVPNPDADLLPVNNP